MRFKIILLGLGMIMTQVASSQTIAPTKLSIADNDQATISLSRQDINRLFVSNDKITSFNAPMNRLAAHNDSSGSIYLNVFGKSPFTAFVSTLKGHHFSLLVVPKSIPGNTIDLVATSPVKQHVVLHSLQARRFEQSSSYEKTLVTLLKESMLGKVPSGYSAINLKALSTMKMFEIPAYVMQQEHLDQSVVAGFLGGELAVRILQVKNATQDAVELSANDFYTPGVRAVSIAHEYLSPDAITNVYEVVSNV